MQIISRDFVEIHRDVVNSPIFRNVIVSHFMTYCLLKAEFDDREIQIGNEVVKLSRGSFFEKLSEMSKDTGLTRMQVRRSIAALQKSGFLVVNPNRNPNMLRHGVHITVAIQ